MKYTVDEARQWAEERRAELDASRTACEDKVVRMIDRLDPEKGRELWDSGCWLQATLRPLGASEEQIVALQFAAGQRSLFGDGFVAVVAYANEFARTGDTVEKPGKDLAEKICAEHLDG